jgi:hypothetical protein
MAKYKNRFTPVISRSHHQQIIPLDDNFLLAQGRRL